MRIPAIFFVIGLFTQSLNAQTYLNLKNDSTRLDFETRENLWEYIDMLPASDSIITIFDRDMDVEPIEKTQTPIEDYMVGGWVLLYEDAVVYITECHDTSDFLSFVLLYKREIIDERYGIER